MKIKILIKTLLRFIIYSPLFKKTNSEENISTSWKDAISGSLGEIYNQKCNNIASSVTEILEYNGEKTEICEIIGQASSTKVYLLDFDNPNLGIVLE